MPEDRIAAPLEIGQLIALVDSLRTGALNTAQSEIVRQLRAGMVALAERENAERWARCCLLAKNNPIGG